jgi:hypothetical protein
MQIEIFLEKMQVVCISINTSYVSILSLHKTWDSLVMSVTTDIQAYTMPLFTTYSGRIICES